MPPATERSIALHCATTPASLCSPTACTRPKLGNVGAGNRITGYLRKYNYACSQNNKLHEEQIHAFTILPESLRSQLRCEVYLPVLDRHPLFRALNMIDEARRARGHPQSLQGGAVRLRFCGDDVWCGRLGHDRVIGQACARGRRLQP